MRHLESYCREERSLPNLRHYNVSSLGWKRRTIKETEKDQPGKGGRKKTVFWKPNRRKSFMKTDWSKAADRSGKVNAKELTWILQHGHYWWLSPCTLLETSVEATMGSCLFAGKQWKNSIALANLPKQFWEAS